MEDPNSNGGGMQAAATQPPAAPPPPDSSDPLVSEAAELEKRNPILCVVRHNDVSQQAREAVRLDFNPLGDERVTEIKALTARLLSLSWGDKGDAARCSAIARTNFETACMWAVKAATAGK